MLVLGDSKERGRLINIKAESIVEWTHEFNGSKVMEPVFWVLSEDVCWYQIQVGWQNNNIVSWSQH